MAVQLIRNQQVVSSNLISSSKFWNAAMVQIKNRRSHAKSKLTAFLVNLRWRTCKKQVLFFFVCFLVATTGSTVHKYAYAPALVPSALISLFQKVQLAKVGFFNLWQSRNLIHYNIQKCEIQSKFDKLVSLWYNTIA